VTIVTDTDRTSLLASWRATGRSDLAAHVQVHGPLAAGDPRWAASFPAALEEAGLLGRGGAGFPAAVKLRVAVRHRRPSVLVVNAVEGEPASSKDSVLLTLVPHMVLDGAQAAAVAMGAERVVVCVPDDSVEVARSVEQAVRQRRHSVYSPVPVEIARPQRRFLAGEESALVDWLNGGPGVPSWRPDKAVPLKLGRRPVLVHNAETLAHMALVARYGPEAFRAAGLNGAAGTTLVTLSGAVEHPGVYEVPAGTGLDEIVGRAWPTSAPAAVLVGGYGGAWIGAHDLSVPFAPGPLAAIGAAPGAGVLVVLPTDACPVSETARIASYMAAQSAGQCGPCVFGLPAIAEDLAALADGRAPKWAPNRIRHRLREVSGRGACRHPDGVTRMVASALDVFAGDFGLHSSGRTCQYRKRPSVLPVVAHQGGLR
jgi:NADH:ubiquinone oxidoreductase subunit F (NADH-binding)